MISSRGKMKIRCQPLFSLSPRQSVKIIQIILKKKSRSEILVSLWWAQFHYYSPSTLLHRWGEEEMMLSICSQKRKQKHQWKIHQMHLFDMRIGFTNQNSTFQVILRKFKHSKAMLCQILTQLFPNGSK